MTCFKDGWTIGPETNQADCLANGGQWLDDDDIPTPPGPSGPTAPGPSGPTAPPTRWNVFIDDLTRIEPLIAPDVMEIAVNIRDEIMTTTLVGALVLRGYYRHFGEAVRLMGRNEQLQLRMLQVWAQLHPFAKEMLAERRSGQARAIRFEKQTYDLVAGLCDALGRSSRQENFRRALAEVKKECRRYVGATPREAIGLCHRNLRGSSLWALAPQRKGGGRSKAAKRPVSRRGR